MNPCINAGTCGMPGTDTHPTRFDVPARFMNCVELTYELPDGVHYRVCTYQPESGPGDKLPVVMLHGFAGSSDSFSHIAPGLNRTVVAVDLLGHGGSTPAADPARYHVERQLDDLTLLLNGIHQAGQGYHLMGYSMGGRLAMRLALRKPAGLKSLAIESSSPGITQESEREQRRKRDHQLAARIRSDMHTFFAGWNRLPLFQSPDDAPAEVRKHFEELQLKNTPAALAANLEGFGAGNLKSRTPGTYCIIHPVYRHNRFAGRCIHRSVGGASTCHFQHAAHRDSRGRSSGAFRQTRCVYSTT